MSKQTSRIGTTEGQSVSRRSFHENSWAVLIGIDEYPEQASGLGPLNCAVNDVLAVRNVLLMLGFPSQQIFLLSNQEATKRGIEEVIVDELEGKVGPTDQVVVFFAGHGTTQSSKSHNKKEPEKEGYLLPVDCDPMRLYSSSISMRRLREMAQRVGAKHFLYLVEACYSGLAIYKTRSISKSDLIEDLLAEESIQILTAGRHGDQVIEVGQHGLFTHVLLDALRGAADLKGWGWLPLDHLAHYMASRVYAESDKRMLPQHGNLSGSGQFIFELSPTDRPPFKSGLTRISSAKASKKIHDQSIPVAPVIGKRPPGPRIRKFAVIGAVSIQSELKGELYLDSERLGIRIESTERVKISDLPVGWHEIVVREGAVSASERVQVLENEIVEIVLKQSLPENIVHEKDRAPMVLVSAGEFLMGSDKLDWNAKKNERPQRLIYLDGFYIDKYPVTNGQYAKFVEATGHKKTRFWRDPRVTGPDQPVIGVTWTDACSYSEWAGKRLCTEAEWEKAARGTDGRSYPWGDIWDPAKLVWRQNSHGRPHPVRRRNLTHCSPYNVVDMVGNVMEWCQDFYSLDYYLNAPERNPKGPEERFWRVLRGGDCSMEDPNQLRVANRESDLTNSKVTLVGFRCAKSVP